MNNEVADFVKRIKIFTSEKNVTIKIKNMNFFNLSYSNRHYVSITDLYDPEFELNGWYD